MLESESLRLTLHQVEEVYSSKSKINFANETVWLMQRKEAVDKDPEDVIDDPVGSRSDPVPNGGWYHFHDDVQIHLLLVNPPNNNTREENMKYQREEKRPHRGVDHDRVTKTSLHKCCLQFCRSFRLVICL